MSDTRAKSAAKMTFPSLVDVQGRNGNTHIILPERGMMCDIPPVWTEFNQYHLDHVDPDSFTICEKCIDSLFDHDPQRARELAPGDVTRPDSGSDKEQNEDGNRSDDTGTEKPTFGEQIPFDIKTAKSNITHDVKREIKDKYAITGVLVQQSSCECDYDYPDSRMFQLTQQDASRYIFEAVIYCRVCDETHARYIMPVYKAHLSKEAKQSCEDRMTSRRMAETLPR